MLENMFGSCECHHCPLKLDHVCAIPADQYQNFLNHQATPSTYPNDICLSSQECHEKTSEFLSYLTIRLI